MVQGENQNARNSRATKYQGGTVHLIASSNEINDSDGSAELSSKSQASVTTTDSDWTITHNNSTGETTLENGSELDFGAQSGYTQTQAVIQDTNNSGEFIIAQESSSNQLTGEQFTYPSGNLTYTFGGE